MSEVKKGRSGRPMVPVIRITNPFNPREFVRENVAWSRKKTLDAYFPAVEAAPVVVSINGKIIAREQFGATYLDKTDNVVICPVPTGGGGAKQILGVVAMIAVTMIAPEVAGFINGPAGLGLAAGSTGLAMLQAGVTFAGALLVSSIFAPPKPTAATSESSTYGIDGAKNTSLESIPVPVNYGQFRLGGNVVSMHVDNVADDNQILYMLINAGEGPVASISDIQINDNPLADYKDVEVQTRLGTPNQTTIPWFLDNIVAVNRSLKLTTDWTYYTTESSVDQLRLDYVAPSGLYQINTKDGSSIAVSVDIDIEYRKVGSSDTDWTTLPDTQEIDDWKDAVATYNGPAGTYYDAATGRAYKYGDDGVTIVYLDSAQLTWTTTDGTPVTDQQQLDYLNQNSGTPITDVVDGEPRTRTTNRVPIYGKGRTIRSSRRGAVRKSISSPRLPTAKYEVRTRRVQPKSTDTTVVDDLYLSDINEITLATLTYPNTALLGLKITLGNQVSGIPSVTFMHGGRLIQTYGAQPGSTMPTWTTAASKNPAWIVWDILTNKRFGGAMPTSRLDFQAFQDWAAYCDSNGYEWNGPIDTEMNVWDAAQLVLRVGHAQLVNVGTRYTVVVEKPSAPVMMFSVANMIEGSYKETWLGMTDRANEIDVTFFDRNDSYKQRTVKVYDPASLTAGLKQNTSAITLYGVTDYETAYKEGQFQLNLNRFILRTVEFSAPLEAVACSVGDLIYVQHDMTQWAQAGRFDAGSTASTVQLDRPVTMEAGKQYKLLAMHDAVQRAQGSILNVVGTSVFLSGFAGDVPVKRLQVNGRDLRVAGTFDQGNGSGVIVDDATGLAPGQPYVLMDTDVIEEYNVVNEPGEQYAVTLQSPMTFVPTQFANWMFGDTDKVKQPFRVKAVTGSHDYKRDITAIEYKPEVYDFSRYGSNVPVIPPKDGVIGPAQSLSLYEETYVSGTSIVSSVVASWATPAAGLYAGADVYVQKNDGPLVKLVDAKNVTSAVIDAAKGDVVTVKVQAYDIFGKRSQFEQAPSATYTVIGEISGIKVGDVTGAGFTWSGRDCKINWRYNSTTHSYEFGSEPTGADAGALDPHFKDYEIRVYNQDMSLRRTEYTADNSYVYIYDKNFADGLARHLVFEVRMRDIFNNLGDPATLDAYNPPPTVTGISVTSTFESASIAYTHSGDPDFAGAIIWLARDASNLASAQAGDSYEVYRGPDSAVLLPGLMFAADYYFKVAPYDAFGPTELIPSEVVHFKTTTLNVEAIADGVLDGSKLIPALQDRIDLIDANELVDGSVNARVNELRQDVFAGPNGLPAAMAKIADIDDVSATSNSANARELHSLQATVNDPDTGLEAAHSQITALNDVSATSTSTAAKSIYQLNSRLANAGGAGVSLEQTFSTQANVNTGLMGQYTVKIDSNGYVAGFGLSSETSTAGVTTSEFVINADKFGVIMPSYPGVKPFTIGAVNGVPRVILSNALIGDASISSAMIGDAQINTLKLAGESITVPVAAYAPDKGRRGNGVDNYVVINEAWINMPEAGMLYMLATGAQGFVQNSRQWRFKIRLNGVDAQYVQGGFANDCPSVSVSKPANAGVNHVEVLWAAENGDVICGYCELFLMGVKK